VAAVVGLEETGREHGGEGDGDEAGDEDGDDDGDGELAEETAEDAAHEEEGDEDGGNWVVAAGQGSMPCPAAGELDVGRLKGDCAWRSGGVRSPAGPLLGVGLSGCRRFPGGSQEPQREIMNFFKANGMEAGSLELSPLQPSFAARTLNEGCPRNHSTWRFPEQRRKQLSI